MDRHVKVGSQSSIQLFTGIRTVGPSLVGDHLAGFVNPEQLILSNS